MVEILDDNLIFMKDHRGEYFGKISHPYRVWKVYNQRFSENTELAKSACLGLQGVFQDITHRDMNSYSYYILVNKGHCPAACFLSLRSAHLESTCLCAPVCDLANCLSLQH